MKSIKNIAIFSTVIIFIIIFISIKDRDSSIQPTLINKNNQIITDNYKSLIEEINSINKDKNKTSIKVSENLYVNLSLELSMNKNNDLDQSITVFLINQMESNDLDKSKVAKKIVSDYLNIFAHESIKPVGNGWKEIFAKYVSLEKSIKENYKLNSYYLENIK